MKEELTTERQENSQHPWLGDISSLLLEEPNRITLQAITHLIDVEMVKHGLYVARAAADDGANSETLSMQSILNLKAGDQVWTQVTYITSGISLLGPSYTHFTAFLLEEDVSLSLKFHLDNDRQMKYNETLQPLIFNLLTADQVHLFSL